MTDKVVTFRISQAEVDHLDADTQFLGLSSRADVIRKALAQLHRQVELKRASADIKNFYKESGGVAPDPADLRLDVSRKDQPVSQSVSVEPANQLRLEQENAQGDRPTQALHSTNA